MILLSAMILIYCESKWQCLIMAFTLNLLILVLPAIHTNTGHDFGETDGIICWFHN